MNPRQTSRRLGALLVSTTMLVTLGWAAAPAFAGWRASNATTASIAYNQGIAFDAARGAFFFDGVTSTTNSGVYRTNLKLGQTAASTAVIPATKEGFNHAGDLSFDPVTRRILLPLECYYPSRGGNTCGTGAIGVVDPATLRFRYYVNLARTQIKKAMWVEISPDGRWIFTSSGSHLVVYAAAQLNATTAARQRAGKLAGIVGADLGPVLPSSAVTGATFSKDPRTGSLRLLLSLNLGGRFEVISFCIGTGSLRPRLLNRHPSTIITVIRSRLNNEPEGLASVAGGRRYPLGGLDWQMMPAITRATLFSRILTYQP
jgi:hypothetical protein